MDGTLLVDAMGQVTINGDLNVTGTLTASNIKPADGQDLTFDLSPNVPNSPNNPESPFAKLLIKGAMGEVVASIDASGSARFKDVATSKVIIAAPAESATPSASISSDEITTNATAGTAVLAAGAFELKINNPNVTEQTLIYVTPASSTLNTVLYVKNKVAQTATQDGQFTVAVDSALPSPVEFNWWIIDLRPND